MADKKKKPHYVNNKEFLQAMVEWKAKCREAEKAGKPQPPCVLFPSEHPLAQCRGNKGNCGKHRET